MRKFLSVLAAAGIAGALMLPVAAFAQDDNSNQNNDNSIDNGDHRCENFTGSNTSTQSALPLLDVIAPILTDLSGATVDQSSSQAADQSIVCDASNNPPGDPVPGPAGANGVNGKDGAVVVVPAGVTASVHAASVTGTAHFAG